MSCVRQVSPAVVRELASHVRRIEGLACHSQWPQVQIEFVTEDLDHGRRTWQSIALAGTMRARFTSDRRCRRTHVSGASRNWRVTGTLGVLRAAAEQGIINVPDTLSKLKTTSFYVDDDLLSAIFDRWLCSVRLDCNSTGRRTGA